MGLVAGCSGLTYYNIVGTIPGIFQSQILGKAAHKIGNFFFLKATPRNSGNIFKQLGLGLVSMIEHIFHGCFGPFFSDKQF